MIRFQDHSVFDLDDRHLRCFGEELVQNAFMAGVKVLDHHERHPGLTGSALSSAVHASRPPAGADPHHRKLRSGGWAGGLPSAPGRPFGRETRAFVGRFSFSSFGPPPPGHSWQRQACAVKRQNVRPVSATVGQRADPYNLADLKYRVREDPVLSMSPHSHGCSSFIGGPRAPR